MLFSQATIRVRNPLNSLQQLSPMHCPNPDWRRFLSMGIQLSSVTLRQNKIRPGTHYTGSPRCGPLELWFSALALTPGCDVICPERRPWEAYTMCCTYWSRHRLSPYIGIQACFLQGWRKYGVSEPPAPVAHAACYQHGKVSLSSKETQTHSWGLHSCCVGHEWTWAVASVSSCSPSQPVLWPRVVTEPDIPWEVIRNA